MILETGVTCPDELFAKSSFMTNFISSSPGGCLELEGRKPAMSAMSISQAIAARRIVKGGLCLEALEPLSVLSGD